VENLGAIESVPFTLVRQGLLKRFESSLTMPLIGILDSKLPSFILFNIVDVRLTRGVGAILSGITDMTNDRNEIIISLDVVVVVPNLGI